MAENIEIIKNYFTLSASVFVQSLTDASVKEAGSQRDSKNPSEHDHEVNHPLPININQYFSSYEGKSIKFWAKS